MRVGELPEIRSGLFSFVFEVGPECPHELMELQQRGFASTSPEGVRSDFTLRTDNQAVSWLRTKRDINRFMARWLDEIEEFRFDVEHVPGRLSPADPLGPFLTAPSVPPPL